MLFSDAKAPVQYIGLVPWGVPSFSVHSHLGQLRELEQNPPILLSQRRFWIATRKQDPDKVDDPAAIDHGCWSCSPYPTHRATADQLIDSPLVAMASRLPEVGLPRV